MALSWSYDFKDEKRQEWLGSSMALEVSPRDGAQIGCPGDWFIELVD